MSNKIKDTDYLVVSSRIRAMENKLLTRERMERMLEARTDEEAAKVLTECGYPELTAMSRDGVDEMLAKARTGLYREMKSAVPEPKLLEVFQMKYDYHNAKVLIKAQAMGIDADRLLCDGGRWSAEEIREAYHRDSLRDFTDAFRLAITQARETLNAGGDPQLADFVLDRAWFAEMHAAAEETGSDFLQGYVRLLTDETNLRSAVRAGRMEKEPDFLRQVLLEGGSVPVHVLAGGKGGDLASLFRTGELSAAAELGAALSAPGSGNLTAFECACDDAVMKHLERARRIAFGEQAVVGYLYARENEFTTIRTILAGRMAGLDADTIRERLRETYG